MSRRVVSQPASTDSPTPSSTGSRSGHQRSSPNALVAWDQPIGDSQLSPFSATSPMARSRKASPSTASPMPTAPRACWVTWAATSPTPVNARPTDAMDAPYSSEPEVGRPAARKATAVPAPTATEAVPTTRPVASRSAWRPMTPARSGSVRPASSSVRVCRRVRNTAISATPITAVVATSKTVMPPMVSRATGGPLIEIEAPLVPTVAAYVARACGVS